LEELFAAEDEHLEGALAVSTNFAWRLDVDRDWVKQQRRQFRCIPEDAEAAELKQERAKGGTQFLKVVPAAFDSTLLFHGASVPAFYARRWQTEHIPGDRAGLDKLALRFSGGAPKGVFRYKPAEEANNDWDQWQKERVQRRMKMLSE
jgi:hypothetical protein